MDLAESLAAAEAELVETNREVAQLAIELEERNRQLDAFATAASHDLKAPLLAMRLDSGIAQEALASGDEGAVQNALGRIEDRAADMVAMVDNLLAYARASQAPQEEAPLFLDATIEAVLRSVHVPDGFSVETCAAPGTFVTDGAMLRQVLQNLIGNAIVHHDRDTGQIKVTARRCLRGVRVEVSDDGPGIDIALRDRVFHPFFSTRRGQGGTGLGLCLVRSIVRAHGSELELGPPGRGLTVAFDWPGQWQEPGIRQPRVELGAPPPGTPRRTHTGTPPPPTLTTPSPPGRPPSAPRPSSPRPSTASPNDSQLMPPSRNG